MSDEAGWNVLRHANEEIATLRSELEAARKDSERLDKLETMLKRGWSASFGATEQAKPESYCYLRDPTTSGLDDTVGEDLRAAIDAAPEPEAQ